MEKQAQSAKKKRRGTLGWVMEFAGRRRAFFLGSVVLAVLGVAASFVPYLIIARIVEQLLAGNREWKYYLTQVLFMALFWLIRVALHSLSTSLSHAATFTVLGGIRTQLCAKLSRIPLGSVLSDNSGTYKNIIVERVDSMETTMAHIIPEFTANLLLPIVMFVYIMTIDWRLGLANLIGAGIGLIFMIAMFIRSRGGYELSIEKTKKLNDTAVEYINGIEVIKAFGKTGSSYEKFVTAAREGADVFINWMRRCIWPQSGMMAFLPATFLGVLPVGLWLFHGGALSAGGFITGIILSAGLITPLVVAFTYSDDLLKMGTIFGEVTEILERDDMERPTEIKTMPKGADIA
ncbi:MAG: ABC transporter ATP-binding protein, partial [Clostridia bacterium]|nr:ABC transporter ATP-binding protein [Clostridia bacterium]